MRNVLSFISLVLVFTAMTFGKATFSPSPTSLNFGSVNIGSTVTLPVTISNPGNSSLVISIITSSDAQYTFTSSALPITVHAGASTTVNVTFTPTLAGAQSGNLVFTHNATGSPSSIPLTGIGQIAIFSLSPTSLSFGTVNVGNTATLPVTVSNTGSGSLVISNITSSNPQYTFTSASLPMTIAGGGSTTVNVTFTPTGEGSVPANLVFTHNASGSPTSLPLSGTGHILTPSIGLSPTSLAFGTVNVGSNSLLPVTINNTGDASLVISNITSSDPQYTFTGTLPITVNAGGSTTLDVTFTPTGEGSVPANLVFTHNAAGSPTSLPLSGTGHILTPSIGLSPTSLAFGTVNVGSSSSLPVTVNNTGDGSLVITNITSSDPQYTFTAGTLPITIIAGGSTTLDVTFTPTGEGSVPANLVFTHNASGSPTSLPLSGTGHILTPSIGLSPTSLAFGTVNVGSSSSLPVTVNNTGDAPLVISNITSSDAQYTFTGTLPITVAAGGSTTLDVTFTPTGEGSVPANLVFTHNAAGSPTSLPLSGTGHILTPSIGLSPTSLAFGTVNVGANSSLPVTINNTGDAPLIISNITSSDAQYTFTGTLPITVTAGGSTTLDVTFTPTGEGSVPGNLVFTHNASGSPTSLPLSGTGHILTPSIGLSPTSLAFGTANVGSSSLLPVIINNTGDAPLVITNITSSDPQYTFTGTLPITVTAGGSTTLDVTFTPTVEGSVPGNLEFTHNASGSPTSLPLSGTGHILIPALGLSPTSLAFGTINVGNTSTLPVTVNNTGDGSLVISNITSSDPQYTFTGSLPITVAAGGSTTLDVTFTPTGEGAVPANLVFTHNASGSPTSLPLSGTGHILTPSIGLSPTSLAFGTINVGNTSTLPVTVNNTGDGSLVISNITSSDPQYTFTGTLPITVAAGGSTTLDVTFTPTGEGAVPANLVFTHNASGSPTSLPLSGTGQAPSIGLSPTSLAFGTVNVGSSSSLPVTVNNTGDAPLVISNITSSDPQYTFTGSLPITVTAGGSTTLDVTFTPTGEGSVPGNLVFTHNASGSPTSLPLSGTGHILIPSIDLSPTSLAFGTVNVGSTSTLPLTVNNTGDGSLVITNITSSDAQYTFTGSLPITVAAGGSTTLDVTFTPTGEGSVPANLIFTHNASGSPTSLPLSGTGHILASALGLSPTSLAFGAVNVGSSSLLPVIVNNTGDAPLVITNITSSDPQYTFSAGTLPITIAAGGNTTVNVTFTPLTAGLQNGNLVFTHNASGSPTSLPLSGTGQAPSIGLSPTSLAFGTVNVGANSSLPVTINNTGDAPLIISNITSSDAQYTFTGTLPITVAAGGSTTLDVTFTPTGEGAVPANLVFTHNASGSPTSLPLSGTGQAPSIGLSPTSLAFGTVNVGANSSLPVTINNTGDAPLIISNITSSDAQYTFTGTLPITVTAGGSTTLDVTFTPTVEGSVPGNLEFTHNASGSPTSLPLSGTGHILIPSIDLSPTSLAFGTVNVGSSSLLPVIVNNTGDAPLVITNITSSDPQYTFTSAALPITIPAGGNSTVDVTFTPVAAGLQNGNLVFTHSASGSPTSLPLSGTGQAPSIGLSPTSLAFGTVNVGSSSSLPVTVNNTGDAPLVISNITSSDPQYTFTGTLPITVTAGGSTTLDVTFTPTGEGSVPGNLVFTHNASGSPTSLPLSGTGHILTPSIGLSPTSLAFGTANVGSSSLLPVIINNTGDAPLVITNITSSDPQYTFTAGTLPITVTAGTSTTLDVTFTPTGEGAVPANLVFTHNASGSPTSLPLSGTGHILTSALGLSPTSLAFGTVNVGNTSTLPVTVNNTGDGSLVISNITSSDPQYTFTGTLPIIVAAGGNSTVDVTFTPTGEGSVPGNLVFTHNASGSPTSLPLSGTGHILTPSIGLSPTSLAFSTINVGSNSSLPVTINNTGDGSLIITNIASSDPQYTFTSTALPITIPAGGNSTVDVTFTPTGEGSVPANLIFTHNASGSPTSLPLSGTGHILASALGLSPTSLAFGAVNVGSSSLLPVIVNNTGDAPLVITNITSSDPQYTFTAGTLPITIAAGGNTTVNVTFTPLTAGLQNGNLVFTHNASGSPTSLPLSGTGQAPSIGLSPTSLAFGTVNVGSSSSLPVTVNNTGDAPLVISNITSSDPQYTFTGSLPITVAAGGSTTLDVTFTPTGEGSVPANLIFTHNASGSPTSLPLSGTGHILASALGLSPTSLAFGAVNVGSSSLLPVIVNNTGDAPLVITNITSSDPQYTFTAGTLPITIAAGGNTTVNVTFTPLTAGLHNGNLVFTHNASGSPTSLPLSGTGQAPSIGLSPTSLAFGTVNVGSTSTLPVTVNNTGDAELVITNITSSDPQYTFTSAALPITIPAGGNSTVDVTFTPTGEGSVPANLVFTHNASGSPTSLPLSGTGHILTSALGLSPTSLSFGTVNVGSTSTLPVTVNNTGDGSLIITNITSSDPQYTFTSTALPITIPAGGNSTVDVTFTPTGEGSVPANLIFTHNASGSPTSLPLSGTGHILASALGLSPTSLAFGAVNVGSSSLLPVIVNNTGDAPLVITNITSSDPQYTFTAGTLPITIAAGGNATVNVTFTPLTAGLQNGNLVFTHNASGSPTSLPLSGTGQAPSIGLSPTSLAFGTVNVGSSSLLPVIVNNTGDAPLVITNITSSDPQYTFTAGTLPITIAAGGNTTVNVTFTPTGEGLVAGNLVFTHNASGSPTSLPLSGTGHILTSALGLSPTSLAFGTVNVGNTSTLPVTVNNTGDASLVISNITSSDPQYTFTAGTLPITIAAGGNTTVNVTFTPLTVGLQSGNLVFTHNASGSPTSLPLSGTGQAPSIGLSPVSLAFGTVNVGSSGTLPVTINNTGDAPLIISNITSSDVQYTFTAGTLPITIAAGGNSTVNVTFTPTGEGPVSGNLIFTHNASGSPTSLPLSGTGHILTSALGLSPTSLNFGTINVGSNSSLPVTVNNTGDGPLVITNITSSDLQYTFTSATLPITIPAGGNSIVNVTFTPTIDGSVPGNLIFTHNASGSPTSLPLSGRGHLLISVFGLSPTSLSFGIVNVGNTSTLPVTVNNTGDGSLVITNITSSDAHYTFTPGTFPITIPAGGNNTVNVTFTPTGEGAVPGNLVFTHNASGSPTSLPLSGTGHILTSVFGLSPTSLSFGTVNVGSNSLLPVTINNTGDGSLVITNITSSDPQYAFTAGTFPITILPGGNSVVNVTFTPTGEGLQNANLVFTHNALGSPSSLPLSGAGHILRPTFAVSPSSLAFGTVNVGNTATLPLTVKNTGDASLIISSIASSEAQYTYAAGTLPITVAMGDSTTINVTFTPTVEGPVPANLVFTHNAAGSPIPLPISGTGHILRPVFVVSPDSLNFDTVNVGNTVTLPVTVNNTGDGQLIISYVTSSETQYTFTAGTLPITVAPGGSTVVNVNFTPADAGLINGILTFNHNAGGGTTTYNVHGIGFIPTFQLGVDINAGWNLVSIPGLHPVNQSVDTWWQYKLENSFVFQFNGLYQKVFTVEPGKGYWMKHTDTRTYNTGDEWPAGGITLIPNTPIPAAEGWNLVGCYNYSVPVSGITTSAGSIVGFVYGYTDRYTRVTQLVPGHGYWIELSQAANIIMPDSNFSGSAKIAVNIDDKWGKITLADKAGRNYTLYTADGKTDLSQFNMPPAPPAGVMDVRYSSQRFVENITEGFQGVDFNGMEYPVTLTVENTSIRVQDITGKAINTVLKAGEKITISNNEINKLMVSGDVIPDEFSLSQNYPNPFNPSTLIQFTLPEDASNVTLTIYDALGQKVSEILNGNLQAGYYKYQWNAGQVASGIYIYQLRTEKFVSTKKMMLLK